MVTAAGVAHRTLKIKPPNAIAGNRPGWLWDGEDGAANPIPLRSLCNFLLFNQHAKASLASVAQAQIESQKEIGHTEHGNVFIDTNP
jgi:hypothetical protein